MKSRPGPQLSQNDEEGLIILGQEEGRSGTVQQDAQTGIWCGCTGKIEGEAQMGDARGAFKDDGTG